MPEVLLLLLCATLAGVDGLAEIELWGEEQLTFLHRLLPYRHDVPSHNTLGGVLAVLDLDRFKFCFVTWAEGLRQAELEVVVIDGKTSRRTRRRWRASPTRSRPSRCSWSGLPSPARWSPEYARHGRERDPARRQDDLRAALLP